MVTNTAIPIQQHFEIPEKLYNFLHKQPNSAPFKIMKPDFNQFFWGLR
jgi:hypothetical protein